MCLFWNLFESQKLCWHFKARLAVCSATKTNYAIYFTGKAVQPVETSGCHKDEENCSPSLFVDDCALNPKHPQWTGNAGRDGKLLQSLQQLPSVLRREVVLQQTPGYQYQEPHITVKGQTLQAVQTLTYLGSAMSHNANIDSEICIRIAKPAALSGKWRGNSGSDEGLASR